MLVSSVYNKAVQVGCWLGQLNIRWKRKKWVVGWMDESKLLRRMRATVAAEGGQTAVSNKVARESSGYFENLPRPPRPPTQIREQRAFGGLIKLRLAQLKRVLKKPARRECSGKVKGGAMKRIEADFADVCKVAGARTRSRCR